MKTENRNGSKIFVSLAYLYILLPFIIFSIGWMGKKYWIPIVLILLYCFKRAVMDTKVSWMPSWNRENIMKIVMALAIICVWVYFSGIGKVVFQNTDHSVRNSIFEILVKYDWPVINYDVNMEVFDRGTSATALIYYIGYWLPSAVVGKVAGLQAGYLFQMFWAVLGIAIVYFFICIHKKRLLIWPLLVLMFFSGLDILGMFFRGFDISTLPSNAHLEWWVEPYQYSSVTTQLFWVFNQAIPAWVCTMLVLFRSNGRSIVFVLACCMLNSTLPFVGLLVFVIFIVLSDNLTVKSNINFLKKIKSHCAYLTSEYFTIQNVLGGGIVGIFSFLYLKNNVSGGLFMGESVYGHLFDNHLIKYLIFILFEVLLYFIFLYRYNKGNKMYYFVVACLCIIPPIKVGTAGDFCMRASIPALLILVIMVIDGIMTAYEKKHYLWLTGMICILCLGSITPIHEFARTFQYTIEKVDEGETPVLESENEYEILNSGNFAGPVENNIFFKYFVK